jgi:Na+/melibiose symporter-like transporter
LLTITVLIGTCGYVISDLLGWKEGLSKKFSQARPFYFIILIATIIGLIINYMTPINPIQILIYAATINTVF